MYRLVRRGLLILAASAFGPLAGHQAKAEAQAVAAAPAFADIAAELRARCASGAFSGTVIVTRDDDRLLHVTCQPPNAPRLGPNTRFKFFSMSKMFTGLAIARLVERGQIDPTARLRLYFRHLPSAWRDVQVGQLLNHSSGIPDYTERLIPEFNQPETDHRAAMMRLLRQLERENPQLAFAPGTRFAYNNFGYELLAQIGAITVGRPFDQVLAELVLRPAGMRDTVVARPRYTSGRLDGSQPVDRLVAGFNGAPGALEPAESLSFVQLGAGALIGTAGDMEAFARALHAGRLVSPALWDRMGRGAFVIRNGLSYNYGLMRRTSGGCRVLQHSGGTNGFANDFAYLPDRNEAVIVFSNFGFASVETLRAQLVDRLTTARPCLPRS